MSWLLFLLIFAHFLADYPLQGEFLANAKNRNTEVGKIFWPHALFAHSFIHAGFVGLLTGSLFLAMGELIIHALTDFMKCEGKLTLNQDQVIHFTCKVLWAATTIYLV